MTPNVRREEDGGIPEYIVLVLSERSERSSSSYSKTARGFEDENECGGMACASGGARRDSGRTSRRSVPRQFGTLNANVWQRKGMEATRLIG